MAWSQTGAAHYHAQQGPPDKGRAIKELFVCYVVYGKVRWSGPLLWSGWISRSSKATPHRYISNVTFHF